MFGLLKPRQIIASLNPISIPNNKFGVHISAPGKEEILQAADLVNSQGGDWGYVTVVIQSNDRDKTKWQNFFDELRRSHLIPIVRIATKPVGDYWEIPVDNDSLEWANFLDSLNWPTVNRYVVIYNEPNHGQEWGTAVDPASYAKILDKTIDSLRAKSSNFFVLNAGLDASVPHQPPNYYDAARFVVEMENAVPGILEKLDGWTSHSYPNPDFKSSPYKTGRGSVRTFEWEQGLLSSLGLKKNLPIFITETGWKHAEGVEYDSFLPTSKEIGQYFRIAFQDVWNNPNIVAITPFILNYTDYPFDHFSFKRVEKEDDSLSRVLGEKFPNYYPQYDSLKEIVKVKGEPVQEDKFEVVDANFQKIITTDQVYSFDFTLKNTGQSIWNEFGGVKLGLLKTIENLEIQDATLPIEKKIEPGQDYIFKIQVKAIRNGTYEVPLSLFKQSEVFQNKPIRLYIEVNDPVMLSVNVKTRFGKIDGVYSLEFKTEDQIVNDALAVSSMGESEKIKQPRISPGTSYKITIRKSFYKSKTVIQTLNSGENKIEFGVLDIDFKEVSREFLRKIALFFSLDKKSS